jgi:KaiC/GvpD/RAD55 family RecA-like ATPase
MFADELREYRSSEHFDAMLEDLDLFSEQLGVTVHALAEQVREAKAEFEERQEAYADHMQDEWKERWRDERDNQRSVSEMFGSLRRDRD